MKPLAPNTLLQNRYLLVHLIGKGGMGEVYLAVDQRLGSAVALKRTFFAGDEALGSAFEREARTLARMRHAVLPKVSDHFTENENQFLVMDHIAGEDLSKRLEATQKPFPLSWVLFWADQLLDALAYLHQHEPPVLHRDIKPQNLKLTDENNIVLLDFGLAKNSIGETRITSSGSVGFTPNYAPMEQIRGTGTSARSDIYSLSATLYQLLTNKVPPDALSRADALLNGSPDPLEPVENLNSEVTKPVSDVILKGLSVSQEQRFASAREMQKELRDAYAKMQKAMSAQTAVFNRQESQFAPQQEIPQGQTEPMNPVSTGAQTPLQSGINTQFMSPVAEKEFSGGETVPYNSQPPLKTAEHDFEKTLAYDSHPPEVSPKQSGIKTEVFGSNFGAESISANDEKPNTSENFAPEATVPLVAADNPTGKIKSDAPVSDSSFEIETLAPGTFPETQPYSQPKTAQSPKPVSPDQGKYQKELYALPPTVPASQTEKKSGGKVFAIVGGLAALLLLAGAVAFGGWYYYKNSAAKVTATPTPTAQSTIAATPTAQPVLVDTNANTNVSMQDLSNQNTAISNQQQITKTETPGATPKPSISSNTVKPTPKPTQVSTAGTPRATPAKTPKKDDRLIINQ
jgi:serine/threonine protein kinase